MSEQMAACACLTVKYDPIKNDNGTLTERWRCPSCENTFVKRFWLDAETARADQAEARVLELEKYQSDHQMDVLVPLDRYEQLEQAEAGCAALRHALRLAKGYGSQGETDEGISVSYYIDKALEETSGQRFLGLAQIVEGLRDTKILKLLEQHCRACDWNETADALARLLAWRQDLR